MKKLISIILAVMLVSALAVTSFAAPTVDYIFNDDGYTYVYGSADDAITDMGLKITNKNGVREYAEFSAIDEKEIDDVNTSGKFGFKIKANGMLNDSFTVKPYNKTAAGTVEGSSYVVNSVNETKEAVAEGTVKTSGDFSVNYSTTNSIVSSGASMTAATLYCGTATRTLVRFDLSDVNVNASDITFSFGTQNNQSVSMANIDFKVFAVDALDNIAWSDAASIAKYPNVGSGNDILDDLPSTAKPIATISENDNFISTYQMFRADVSEYIKAKKAAGVTTVTMAIQMVAPTSTIYLVSKETTSSSANVKSMIPALSWK